MQQKAGRDLLSTLGLLIAAGTSQAAEVHGLFKMGFDMGGDTLTSSTLILANGSSSSIKANEGFYIGGGVALV